MVRELFVRGRRSGLLAISVAAAALMACGTQGDSSPSGENVPGADIHVMTFEAQADGSLKAVEHLLAFKDFKDMHDRRLAHMQEARSGTEKSEQALTYRGAGDSYYPISACDDDRTTWLYSIASGWDPASWQYGGWLGCVGAAVEGSDWTGTVDLSQLTFDFYSYWDSNLHSLWVSNTYSVQMCSGGNPNVCTFWMSPWTTANLTALRYLSMM